MRLMSDLITYLRDLLIYKAKPDALGGDIDAEAQQMLAAQSELIDTDRLLGLIDQFAEAEGRMKWAPNKKLHFEVALIKAIQSLNQVTLNEVIENLRELRDGPRNGGLSVAESTGGSATGKSGLPAKKSPVSSASATSKPAARVAEKPAPEKTRPEGKIDPAATWDSVRAKISAPGFLKTLADSLTPLGIEGRSFILGYPPDQKFAVETTATASNRRQLESLLSEVSGQELKLKLEGKEGLTSSRTGDAAARDKYKDDPLIQEALEMFKGEIKS
jgi:DNA polymerase-3 subunit gamma/tau